MSHTSVKCIDSWKWHARRTPGANDEEQNVELWDLIFSPAIETLLELLDVRLGLFCDEIIVWRKIRQMGRLDVDCNSTIIRDPGFGLDVFGLGLKLGWIRDWTTGGVVNDALVKRDRQANGVLPARRSSVSDSPSGSSVLS